jgi:glutamine synthetase
MKHDAETAATDRVRKLKAELIEKGVQYCFATFVDVHGIPKSKCVPIAKFEEMCSGSELYTVGANEGMGLVGPHEDECQTIPDLDSCVVFPWDNQYAWLSSNLSYHGNPYEGSPRDILIRVTQQAKAMGYSLQLGFEPEFYVLKKNETTGKYEPLAPVAFKQPNTCYDVSQTLMSMQFLDPMCRYIEQLGWGVHSFDQECGKGQYEFDFHYTDALTTADRFIFLRLMAKEVAASLGAIATFMPKPFSNDFRSGAHFNMSLNDASGKNVFIGGGAKYGLNCSKLCLNFVGGLLKHASAITAVCCPTFNSYKGLIAQGDLAEMSWAPVLKCYGSNNRSAMLRLPMSRPCVENRAVDMSVNPYLGAALSLAAGLEGIRDNLDPGEPLNDNLYTLSDHDTQRRKVDRLPQTLLDAVRAFEEDSLVTETFGATFQQIYAEQKRKEFAKAFYRVSDEERAEMLSYI